MNKTLCISTLAVLLGFGGFISVAFADVSPGVFHFVKSITLPSDFLSAQYVKVDVDREVSMHALADLSDLRIVANGREEVPYQLVIENEAVRNESTQARIYDLSTQNGETAFVADIGELGRVHDHISIRSDSQNFKRKVSVYASDTPFPLEHIGWRLITDQGYIYNFHDTVSGFDAGSGEVTYPANTSRYLKVVIASGEGKEVHVTDVNLYRLVAQRQKEQSRTFPLAVTENKERKTTELVVDQGGEGVPTRQIVLQIAVQKNFNRRAVVHASSDGVSWNAVGEGYLFSLETPLFSGNQLALSYRETRARYIRVVVMNEDDSAVSWKNEASLSGVVRSVVFNADPVSSYVLYYGNTKGVAPHYDFARYFQYVESASLSYATLGAETPNMLFETPPPPTVPFSERNASFLNGALVLLVAILALLTLSYLKKLKLSKRGPQDDGHGNITGI